MHRIVATRAILRHVLSYIIDNAPKEIYPMRNTRSAIESLPDCLQGYRIVIRVPVLKYGRMQPVLSYPLI
jgi:hypothetical protein